MIPGNRSVLNNYLTPVLNDVWNTAPYLHDGSAPTLLDVVRPCLTQLEACDQAGKGRNVDDQHGGTSFLSARQLNDLVAFQKAPHAPIGEVHALDGVRLELRRVRVRFGKPAGRDALMLVGGAKLPQSLALDPAAVAVTVSVGVPAGERMAVVERTVAAGEFRTNRARTTFRFADPRGTRHAGLRSLVLTVRNGQLGVRLAAAGLDLSSLRAASPDYTVGIEIGGTTVGVSRLLRKNRRGTIVHWP
jgi:hypothetical protein